MTAGTMMFTLIMRGLTADTREGGREGATLPGEGKGGLSYHHEDCDEGDDYDDSDNDDDLRAKGSRSTVKALRAICHHRWTRRS